METNIKEGGQVSGSDVLRLKKNNLLPQQRAASKNSNCWLTWQWRPSSAPNDPLSQDLRSHSKLCCSTNFLHFNQKLWKVEPKLKTSTRQSDDNYCCLSRWCYNGWIFIPTRIPNVKGQFPLKMQNFLFILLYTLIIQDLSVRISSHDETMLQEAECVGSRTRFLVTSLVHTPTRQHTIN